MGLTFALLLLPVGFASTAFVILVSGALWAPALARGLDTTLRYTVDKTTRELLFLPLAADLKYRAKPFIDVTMDRFARAMAALLVLVLIKPWGLGLDWRGLSYASISMTGLWIAMALVARKDYLGSFRAGIGERAIAPDTIRTNVDDAATIETLVEELSNPDEEAVLYAIDMLQALDKPNLITPLLLHHDSPRVRARTLHSLATARSRVAVRWAGAIERLIQDDDVEVRAGALRALAALSQEDPSELLRVHLADPEPRVAVAAATALARSPVETDREAAEATLKRLADDTRDAGVPARREVAAALGHIADPGFRRLLVPLLYDNRCRGRARRDSERPRHGGVGRPVPARPDLAARPSCAQGRGARRARRVRGGDRSGAGARGERSARARLDSPAHSRHAGADAHAGVDGRAGGMSRGS